MNILKKTLSKQNVGLEMKSLKNFNLMKSSLVRSNFATFSQGFTAVQSVVGANKKMMNVKLRGTGLYSTQMRNFSNSK